MTTISARGISFSFDASTGLLEQFTVNDEGREIAPLHRAPWVGTGEVMPETAAPHMATLGGDFFCAPFGATAAGSPLHGWPANSHWSVDAKTNGYLHAVLDRPVFGATLIKELGVIDGHPFVYQRHIFVGGAGRIPVSNHANLSLPDGGVIRTSAKAVWETPGQALESDPDRGRSALVYPAQTRNPTAFPGRDGFVDLTRYPWGACHEDFVFGIEARGHSLGWTAVTRPKNGDLFLSLRHAERLPMTMLWHSNGGRDYAPWSSRHTGCLGIEEGAAAHLLAVTGECDLTGPGCLTLDPDGKVEVRHIIGAINWPSGTAVDDICVEDNNIVVMTKEGPSRTLGFCPEFLGL